MQPQTRLKIISILIAVVMPATAFSKPTIDQDTQLLRYTDPYKRAYTACSTAYDRSRLVYLSASIQQTIGWLKFDPKLIEREMARDYHLSNILERDIQDAGFDLALLHCGLSEKQKRYFVLDLIALDVFGKMLVLSGTAKLAYVSIGISKKLFKLFPKTFMAGSLASLLSVAYNKLKKSEAHTELKNAQTLSSEEIDTQLSLDSYNKNYDELRLGLIELIDQDIENTHLALANAKTPKEISQLEEQLRSIQAKRQLLN